MAGLNDFLEDCKRHCPKPRGKGKGNGPSIGGFLGLLNVLIGRRISTRDGAVLSTGLTWRELAVLLNKFRWDPEAVRELGLDPERLPMRDRQRYWYTAIALANVDS